MREPTRENFRKFQVAFVAFLVFWLTGCFPGISSPLDPTPTSGNETTVIQLQEEVAAKVRATDTAVREEGGTIPLSPIEGHLSEEGINRLAESIAVLAIPDSDGYKFFTGTILPSTVEGYALILTDFHEKNDQENTAMILSNGMNSKKETKTVQTELQDYDSRTHTTLFAVRTTDLPPGLMPRGIKPTDRPFNLNNYKYFHYLGAPVSNIDETESEIEIRLAGDSISNYSRNILTRSGEIVVIDPKVDSGSSGLSLLGLTSQDTFEVVAELGEFTKITTNFSTKPLPAATFKPFGKTLSERMKKLDKKLPKLAKSIPQFGENQ